MSTPPSNTSITDSLQNLGMGETPVKAAQSEGIDYLTGGLDAKRQAVLKDLPSEVIMLPAETFIRHLLPSSKIPEREMGHIHDSIEKELYDTASSKWKDVMMAATGTEAAIFRHFGKICNEREHQGIGLNKRR